MPRGGKKTMKTAVIAAFASLLFPIVAEPQTNQTAPIPVVLLATGDTSNAFYSHVGRALSVRIGGETRYRMEAEREKGWLVKAPILVTVTLLCTQVETHFYTCNASVLIYVHGISDPVFGGGGLLTANETDADALAEHIFTEFLRATTPSKIGAAKLYAADAVASYDADRKQMNR
jgi:hypothetical protein